MDELKALRESILNRTAEFARLRLQRERAAASDAIRYGGRNYDEKEVVALVDAALDFWLTAGPHAERFERALAARVGAKRALFTNSGSSANLLALLALSSHTLGERRIRPGDEAITVAAAFPTTVAPILQCGAVPVFLDVDPATANPDVSSLEKALSEKTKAVVFAHALGNPFDAEAVASFCRERGLWFVEDACDALGAEWNGRPVGSFGDFATFSFYPSHHITTGEGGAICTSDPLFAKIAQSIRDWGRDCVCAPGQDGACGRRFSGRRGALPQGYDHKYVYGELGCNLKGTDLQAAIGCAQLEKLSGFLDARKRNRRRLAEGLRDVSRLRLQESLPGAEPAWFGLLATVAPDAGFSRDGLVRHLEAQRIQTRMLFAGNLTRQPCFSALREGVDYRIAEKLAATDALTERAFWIGVHPGLSESDLDRMILEVRRFCTV